MCVSFSGRCLLSRYLSGRDSNRGQCAQPCRWKWDIRPSESEENWFTLGEEKDSAYILNADDLCMAPFLGAVCEAGVDSLKIEGRAKSFYYVASVTSAYRRALDTYLSQGRDSLCPEDVLAELMKTSHRHYSTGFYFGPQGATENRKSGSYQRAWDVAGVVENWDEGMAACTQRGKFEKGDLLEILTPGGETLPVKATFLLDENGEELTSAPCSGMEFYLPVAQEVPPLSILRKKVCVGNDGKEGNLC